MTNTNAKQSIRTTINNRLILFKNIINHAKNLCEANSESEAFLTAVNDFRFEGIDRSEIRSRLSGYGIVAFDLIAEQVICSMNSYRMKCGLSDSDTVVGGGLAVYADTLKTMALATKDSEAGSYFDALYKVQFQNVNADEVEASLPTGAQMVFVMTQRALFGEPERKLTRSEINSRNARSRWNKERAKKKVAEESTKSHVSEIPPEIADISAMLDDMTDTQSEQIPELSLPDTSFEVSSNVDTPAETVPNSATDSAVEAVKSVDHAEPAGYKFSCENANGCKSDANPDSHPLYKNKSKNKKNNNTPPYTHTVSYSIEQEECVDLRAEFDRLCRVYPKQEDLNRAWKAFVRLHPDEALIENIHKGLLEAKQVDFRFQNKGKNEGYRFTPTLRNWIWDEGWKSENMLHGVPSADILVDQTQSNTPAPHAYSQRPCISREEAEQRSLNTLRAQKAKYGNMT